MWIDNALETEKIHLDEKTKIALRESIWNSVKEHFSLDNHQFSILN